jgi:hypothetical protein
MHSPTAMDWNNVMLKRVLLKDEDQSGFNDL